MYDFEALPSFLFWFFAVRYVWKTISKIQLFVSYEFSSTSVCIIFRVNIAPSAFRA